MEKELQILLRRLRQLLRHRDGFRRRRGRRGELHPRGPVPAVIVLFAIAHAVCVDQFATDQRTEKTDGNQQEHHSTHRSSPSLSPKCTHLSQATATPPLLRACVARSQEALKS